MHLFYTSIRFSSRSRQFFSDLKKFYRSTTSKLSNPMAKNRSQSICFVFDQNDDPTKILIQMTYEIPSCSIRRQFNLLRSIDDSLSQTIRRLISNIEQVTKKTMKKTKQEIQEKPTNFRIELIDEQDQPIDPNLSNREAWRLGKYLLINEEKYSIEYNAPAIIKFRFPDVILTNTITIGQVEIDHGHWKHSLFDWYVADEIRDDDERCWTHVHRGPFCTFKDEHENKFVRLICLPRNDQLREGMPGEHRSTTRIQRCPTDLPMNVRHELTKEFFPIDSNLIRVVSYNLLANGYAASTGAAEALYPFCPTQFLDHHYRKPLLLREILGYHADFYAFQECDTSFYQRELTLVLNEFGFDGEMKVKSESVREGEAIFYRRDRFSLIDTHDVTLKDYLRQSEHLQELRTKFERLPTVLNELLERNTALQIVALRSLINVNDVFLICNTHLYFHYSADVLRCLQTIVACERIKEMKRFYEKQNKTVSIIWCGDFNANVTSLSFHLLFTGTLLLDENHRSFDSNYSALIEDQPYRTELDLSTFSNYAYTNYTPKFNGILDHIFYDSNKFEFHRAIPMPTHEEVTEFIGIPSCKIPSDHLALINELKML